MKPSKELIDALLANKRVVDSWSTPVRLLHGLGPNSKDKDRIDKLWRLREKIDDELRAYGYQLPKSRS